MATGNGGQVHIVYDMIYAQSCIELERPETVVHLSIFAMRLPSIIERSIEVILPDKVLLRQVPVADAIVTVFAVGRVLIAQLEKAALPVVESVGKSPVTVPVMLRLVASRALPTCAAEVEHVALRVFLREAVVAETVRYVYLIAPLVEPPRVVGGCLKQVLCQFIAVVTVEKRGSRALVSHVSASRIDGASALQVDAQAMVAVCELISTLPDEGAEVAKTRAVGKGSDRRAIGRGRLLLLELALVVYVGTLSTCIYVMMSRAVVDFDIHRKRPPG